MAKTKNISLRFDEDDLKLALDKSGFAKNQKLFDFLLSEFVRPFKFEKDPFEYIRNEITEGIATKILSQPVKRKNIKIAGYEFQVKEVQGLGDTYAIVPTFKNDVERMFWEEKQKLKNK